MSHSDPAPPGLASSLLQERTPVVDTFGDLGYFAGEGGDERLMALLRDLLVGYDESVAVLGTVELSPVRRPTVG